MTENPFPNANFLKAAEALHLSILGRGMTTSIAMIAAALEKAHDAGLERAAALLDGVGDHGDDMKAEDIRAMKGGGGNGDS